MPCERDADMDAPFSTSDGWLLKKRGDAEPVDRSVEMGIIGTTRAAPIWLVPLVFRRPEIYPTYYNNSCRLQILRGSAGGDQ